MNNKLKYYLNSDLIKILKEDRELAIYQRDTGAKENKEFYTGMVAAFDSCIETISIVIDSEILAEIKLGTDNCPSCASVGMWTDTKNEGLKMCLACGLVAIANKKTCGKCGRMLEKALDGDLVCPVHG